MSLEALAVYAVGTRREIDIYLEIGNNYKIFYFGVLIESLLFASSIKIAIPIAADLITRICYAYLKRDEDDPCKEILTSPGVIGILRSYISRG